MPNEEIGQFLFNLPNRPLTKKERLVLIKRAIQNDEDVSQEALDRVMAKLLEEIQSEN